MAIRHLLLASIAVCLSLPLAAQESGGVHLKGNTTIDAHAQDVNTVATGTNNTAITNIGNISESGSGDRKVSVDVKNVENVVGGSGHKGCISIGGDPCK